MKEDRRTNLSSLFSWLKTKHSGRLMRFQCQECPGREGREKAIQTLTTVETGPLPLSQASVALHSGMPLAVGAAPQILIQAHKRLPASSLSCDPKILTGEGWHSCLGLSSGSHGDESQVISCAGGRTEGRQGSGPQEDLTRRGGGAVSREETLQVPGCL